MFVLHIPDLLTTDLQRRDLSGLARLPGLVGREQFDVVVISGDLTRSGQTTEFAETLQALERHVLPLVGHSQSNVVLVPGNHDVDFEKKALIPTPAIGRSLLPSDVEKFRQAPGGSDLRLWTHSTGLNQWFERHPKTYPRRFENFDRFVVDFYGKKSHGVMTRFSLADRPARQRHWSLHPFRDHRMVFIGINTCANIDQLWPGACLPPDLFAGVTDALRKLAKRSGFEDIDEWLRVAVWHHGFTGHGSGPDRLSLRELEVVRDLGISMILHGHHNEVPMPVDVFDDRLLLLTTGTMDRDDDTVSILQLSHAVAQIQHVHLESDDEEPVPMPIQLRRTRITERGGPWVRSVRRTWTIGADCVSQLTIRLDGIRLGEPASPNEAGYCIAVRPSIRSTEDTLVTPKTGRWDVDGQGLSGERIVRWVPRADDNEAELEVSTPSPSVTDEDLSRMRNRPGRPSSVPSNREVVSHVQRFGAQRFELVLDMRDIEGPLPSHAEPFVERLRVREGVARWERDHDEERRLARDDRLRYDRRRFELEIPAPVIGWRYGITYVPTSTRPMSDESWAILDYLLGEVREGEIPSGREHADGLTGGIEAELREALEVDSLLSAGNAWVGYLWDVRNSELVPWFGSELRGARRWRCGEGMVGSAFRRGESDVFHGIHRTRDTALPRDEHVERWEWGLAYAILDPFSRLAIGAISFVGNEATTKLEQLLVEIAKDRSKRHPASEELHTKLIGWFLAAVDSKPFPPRIAEGARRLLTIMGEGVPSEPGPSEPETPVATASPNYSSKRADQVYDVFVSYSTVNSDFVEEELLPVFRDHGVNAFVDFEDFDRLERLRREIHRAQARTFATVIVYSEHWRESDWTQLELEVAPPDRRHALILLDDLHPDDDPYLWSLVRTDLRTKDPDRRRANLEQLAIDILGHPLRRRGA